MKQTARESAQRAFLVRLLILCQLIVPGVAIQCGGLFVLGWDKLEVTLTSPGYPDRYPKFIQCQWIIVTPIVKLLRANFLDFSVEGQAPCLYDKLLVDSNSCDFSSPKILCGESQPEPIISSGNILCFRFLSDVIVNMRGFKVEVTVIADNPFTPQNFLQDSIDQSRSTSTVPIVPCNLFPVVVTSDAVVVSPGYGPGKTYPPNSICRWLVYLDAYHEAIIRFNTMDIESHEACSFDSLQILEGEEADPNYNLKFCGPQLPDPVTINSPKLIMFTSDGMVQSRGFSAFLEFVSLNESGSLSSKHGGGDYLTSSPGSSFKITSTESLKQHSTSNSAIQPSTALTSNSVIYSIASSRSSTTEITNRQWLSKASFIKQTDNWSFTCSPNIPLTTGVSEKKEQDGVSDSYGITKLASSHSSDYTSTFAASMTIVNTYNTDRSIELPFMKFELGSHTDYVHATETAVESTTLNEAVRETANFDRSTTDKANNGFTGSRSSSSLNYLNFASNSAFITASAVSSEISVGFNDNPKVNSTADGHAVTIDICSQTFFKLSASRAIVRSPVNQNGVYPVNVRCAIVVASNRNSILKGTFQHMDLEDSAGCIWDSLEISSKSHSIGKFCGTDAISFLTEDNAILISFVSDAFLTKTGFILQINVEEMADGHDSTMQRRNELAMCDSIFDIVDDGDAIIVTSPGYKNGQYPLNRVCDLKLFASSAIPIWRLTVQDLDIEMNIKCAYDYAILYDGFTPDSSVLARLCGNKSGEVITTSGPCLWLHFSSDQYVTKRGFKFLITAEIFYGGPVLGETHTWNSATTYIEWQSNNTVSSTARTQDYTSQSESTVQNRDMWISPTRNISSTIFNDKLSIAETYAFSSTPSTVFNEKFSSTKRFAEYSPTSTRQHSYVFYEQISSPQTSQFSYVSSIREYTKVFHDQLSFPQTSELSITSPTPEFSKPQTPAFSVTTSIREPLITSLEHMVTTTPVEHARPSKDGVSSDFSSNDQKVAKVTVYMTRTMPLEFSSIMFSSIAEATGEEEIVTILATPTFVDASSKPLPSTDDQKILTTPVYSYDTFTYQRGMQVSSTVLSFSLSEAYTHKTEAHTSSTTIFPSQSEALSYETEMTSSEIMSTSLAEVDTSVPAFASWTKASTTDDPRDITKLDMLQKTILLTKPSSDLEIILEKSPLAETATTPAEGTENFATQTVTASEKWQASSETVIFKASTLQFPITASTLTTTTNISTPMLFSSLTKIALPSVTFHPPHESIESFYTDSSQPTLSSRQFSAPSLDITLYELHENTKSFYPAVFTPNIPSAHHLSSTSSLTQSFHFETSSSLESSTSSPPASTTVTPSSQPTVESSLETACSGIPSVLTSESGSVSSPGFMKNQTYPPDITCNWVIEGGAGKNISIQFLNFSLELHLSCSYDFLELYNITDGSRSLIGRYCGGQLPDNMTSSAQSVAIRFVSDRVGNYAGFLLAYKVYDVSAYIPPCPDGRTRCKNSTLCIPTVWLCDGEKDCAHGDDEEECNGCSDDEFACWDHTCLPFYHVCDGTPHCSHGEDESQCVKIDPENLLLMRKMGMWFLVCFNNDWVASNKGWACAAANQGDPLSVIAITVPSMFYMGFPMQDGNTSSPGDTQQTYPKPIEGHISSTCPGNNVVSIQCSPRECGKQDSQLSQPYILGSTSSVDGQWPWMVALYTGSFFRCGGSLISKQWVVSAGHCVYDLVNSPQTTTARFGHANILSPDIVIVRIAEVVLHPQNNYIYENDISLLRLETPVNITDNQRPVCLNKIPTEQSLSTSCYVAGWGETDSSKASNPQMTQILHHAKIKIWDQSKCEAAYPGEIKPTMMCAGYDDGEMDACKGDSGGPLMCWSPNNLWKIVGVVSWGKGCGQILKPGVYTRVDSYLDWIRSTIDEQVNYGISCDFEHPSICGYSSQSEGAFMWTRRVGGLNYPSRPIIDNTYKNISGHYLYTYVPYGIKYTSATITTPPLSPSEDDYCLHASIIIQDCSQCKLEVRVTDSQGDQSETMFQVTSTVSTNWQRFELDIAGSTQRIHFISTSGKYADGGIGLDDVSLISGLCEGSANINCDFSNIHNGFCHYDQDMTDDFDWQVIRVTIPNNSTEAAYLGESAVDAFLRAQEVVGYRGDKARIISPAMKTSIGLCLSFHFRISSKGAGTLYVCRKVNYDRSSVLDCSVWSSESFTNLEPNIWIPVQVVLSASDLSFSMVFQMSVGEAGGYFDVDNVYKVDGDCL